MFAAEKRIDGKSILSVENKAIKCSFAKLAITAKTKQNFFRYVKRSSTGHLPRCNFQQD